MIQALLRAWVHCFKHSLSLPHSYPCVAVESGASTWSYPTSGHIDLIPFYESKFLLDTEYDQKGKELEVGE